jgi:hypothetical protein
VTERYLLAVERTSPEPPWLGALITVLQGEDFRARMRGIPGYDLAGSGRIVDLASASRPEPAAHAAAGPSYA